MVIKHIWQFLSDKEKNKFLILLCLSIVVLFFEIISIGTIFPFIYSLTDENFLDKYVFLSEIYEPFNLQKKHFSIFVLFFLLTIILIKNSFLAFFLWIENKFFFEAQEKISKRLFANLIDKDYSFHLINNSADLITRIRTDSTLIKDTISALFNFFQSIIFISGILVFLIFLEPIAFTITCLAFLLLGSLFYKFTSKKMSEVGKIRQKFEIAKTKKLQESFSGIKEIKTFLLKNIFIKDYDLLSKSIAKTYAIRGLILKLPKVFIETVVLIVIIILTIILLDSTKENTKVFALLGVFAVSAIKIIPHVYSVLNALNIFKFSKKPIDYYKENLADQNFEVNSNHQIELKFKDKIFFKKVFFKYPEKYENVLENLNFEINKGDFIHLKGNTGAGKTTLIDLLLGLQVASSGEISIDETNIEKLQNCWLNFVSYVPQSIYLFDDTIKNNITLGKKESEIDKKNFSNSIRNSELEEFINKLPNKENTMIGEVGSKISGGQKQRIGLARALYKKSEIIILDEATNALDFQTEKQIYQNLSKLKDKTLIVINHKDISAEFNFKIFKIKDKQLIINEKN